MGTKLLGFSIGRGSGALKGLIALMLGAKVLGVMRWKENSDGTSQQKRRSSAQVTLDYAS